jgi:hypothetical protein
LAALSVISRSELREQRLSRVVPIWKKDLRLFVRYMIPPMESIETFVSAIKE